FATDFARTLRARGIEAWAIGQDNQLEFAIPTAPRATPPPAAPVTDADPAPPPAAARPLTPNAVAHLATVAEAVKQAPGKLQKIDLLRAYLTTLAPDDAALGALFLTGRPFPQSSGRALHLGWAAMKRALLQVT